MNLINNHFNDIGQIQKIYSSATTIDIAIRFPGNTQHLYIGRGAGIEGIWASNNRIPSNLRKIDKFLEYLRRYLSGFTYQKLEIDSLDRCVAIKYGRSGKLCSFLIFYAGRDLYFANIYLDDKSQKMMVFKSWENKAYEYDNEDIFNVFNEVGRTKLNKSHDAKDAGFIEEVLDKEFTKIDASRDNRKQKKFYSRKISKIQQDLERLEKSQALLELASTEEDFSTYPKKTKIFDVRFNFEGKTHFQRRDEVFQKAKRLKKNKGLLRQRLAETIELMEQKKTVIKNINPLTCVAPVWRLKKEANKVQENSQLDYKVSHIEGVDYAIGKTAFGNDQMRKLWAKKDDIWFHFEYGVSPHLIVKLHNRILSDEVFKNVAKILLEVANLNYSEVDLIYTAVKNLKGVKGTKGKVIYKKEKHLRVKL